MSGHPKCPRYTIAILTLALAIATQVASAAAPDPQAIAEVRAGKRAVAQASWWGFQPEESTAALQAAIDSGAKKVVVEKMPSPWIVDQLRLASDQELFFEAGAEVLAKQGAFHGSADSLFSAAGKKNIKLIGPGATLRMRRAITTARTTPMPNGATCSSSTAVRALRSKGSRLPKAAATGFTSAPVPAERRARTW